MGRCPHCGDEVERPNGSVIRSDAFFKEGKGADVSGQQHVQLSCPSCDYSLGYLAVGAAAGTGE